MSCYCWKLTSGYASENKNKVKVILFLLSSPLLWYWICIILLKAVLINTLRLECLGIQISSKFYQNYFQLHFRSNARFVIRPLDRCVGCHTHASYTNTLQHRAAELSTDLFWFAGFPYNKIAKQLFFATQKYYDFPKSQGVPPWRKQRKQCGLGLV